MEAHRHEDRLMTGRPATDDVIPGAFALSVGMPDLPAPEGWRWVKLTDVARLESGHTPSRKHPEYWDGDIRWLGIQDARQHHGREIHETRQTVTQLGIANSSARILPAGSVCLSRTASVGYVVRLGRPMATSQDFVNWVCSKDLDPEFLMYLFIAEADSILRFGKGSTHTTVYFPEVKAFHVCLPPPAEQRRIVAKVEALLARVNAARARLARVPAILKRFRQSVLAAACSGRLTEDWRTNREDSLADSASPDLPIFEQGTPQAEDLPREWRWVPFECLLETLRMGTTIPPQQAQTAFPVLRSSSVRTMGIDYSDVRFLPERPPERDTVKEDDLLITRLSGSLDYVANCARVGNLGGQEYAYPDRLFRARLSNGGWSRYLELCFANPDLRSLLAIESKSSAGHQRVSMNGIRAFPIPFAPLQEQQEIVHRVGALFALADNIEQRAATSLRRADRLTQSILSKAFRGELASSQAAE
ncbi:MAG: restriction endonuclease subunit S [Thermoanaerobaculaceae bacterium]